MEKLRVETLVDETVIELLVCCFGSTLLHRQIVIKAYLYGTLSGNLRKSNMIRYKRNCTQVDVSRNQYSQYLTHPAWLDHILVHECCFLP